MFESAELGHKIDKAAFREREPRLREQLLDAQFDLREQAKFPVIILVGGVAGAGASEIINLLYEWLDSRFLATQTFSVPTDEERDRPYMWRFWRVLPPKGRIGIFADSWYTETLERGMAGEMSAADLDQRLDQINRFEAMLVNEEALVLKFWFHLTKQGQRERLTALEKDPRSAWRVTKGDWRQHKRYKRLQEVAGHVLRLSNTPWAPWVVVDGSDDRYRMLQVSSVLLGALLRRLADPQDQNFPVAPPMVPNIDQLDVLTALDLTQKRTREDYEGQLAKWQGRLGELVRQDQFRRRALILAFEGQDAAGKGGAIRRVTAALDPRQYQVVPVAAPTEEERAQPYLWRFWRHIPRKGRLTLFDRTWYGRVLVERVEGLCGEADWLRAYAEINDFEHDLHQDGVILVKFWLQISKEEQLRRFQGREQVAFKRFKITAEDWRNREKWDLYHQAVCDMVDRTSTGSAPWTLIEAEDKYFARIKILRTICKRLEEAW